MCLCGSINQIAIVGNSRAIYSTYLGYTVDLWKTFGKRMRRWPLQRGQSCWCDCRLKMEGKPNHPMTPISFQCSAPIRQWNSILCRATDRELDLLSITFRFFIFHRGNCCGFPSNCPPHYYFCWYIFFSYFLFMYNVCKFYMYIKNLTRIEFLILRILSLSILMRPWVVIF